MNWGEASWGTLIWGGGASAVPGLSNGELLLLAVILGLAGSFLLRRRQRWRSREGSALRTREMQHVGSRTIAGRARTTD